MKKNEGIEVREESTSNIANLFRTFSSGAMAPKPYKKKVLPHSVTASLPPDMMETLNVIACRLGATRANIASHILMIGLVEAAVGCGFIPDSHGNIPDDQKQWDSKSRNTGFIFSDGQEDE